MRSLAEIRSEIEALTEQRREVFHALSQGHNDELAAKHGELERQIQELWDEHREARAHIRFGDRDEIIKRARAEERLDRAA
jgi:hypothetical protein